MIVSQLRLRNFRNYAAQEILLPSGLVALTGDNGQGKTNLLEAICVLATTKSPLVERDRELMRWGARETRLEAEIEFSRGPYLTTNGQATEKRLLEYGWKLEGNSLSREMRAGGVPQSALASWLGQMQVIAFFPHDLVIITGEPGERRRFLNLELGKSRPAHFADAARYKRALQQRNALLKHLLEARFRGRNSLGNAAEGLGTLGEWNKQVIAYGARILAQRAQFLRELAPILDETHRALSGRDETFSVVYAAGVTGEKNIDSEYSLGGDERVQTWSALFQAALERDHETDARRGGTQSGPHRDDLIFRLGDMDLRRFGSQGQQRLAVLALKVALARWVENVTGESPILLLDDALSELDATRRKRLLEMAAQFSQSVLTATDEKLLEGAAPHRFSVENGRVVPAESQTPESPADSAAVV
jgi:DNA replication and repair protein RecF